MISGILFDYGGTLDSDGGHWFDRTLLVYQQLGLNKIDKTLIKEAFYWAEDQADHEPAMRTALYRDMMQRHFRWQFQKLKLHDRAKENEAIALFVRAAERTLLRNRRVLAALKQEGYRMGVVSNSYGNIETLCREFGYNDYLDVLIDSAVENIRKPDPKIYNLAAERLGLPPENILMVGDNYDRDILPARLVGMKTAWLIGNQERTPQDPSQVDFIIRSLEDLPERIKSAQPVSA
jgi:putative hydrolase of the HAD superfamily